MYGEHSDIYPQYLVKNCNSEKCFTFNLYHFFSDGFTNVFGKGVTVQYEGNFLTR